MAQIFPKSAGARPRLAVVSFSGEQGTGTRLRFTIRNCDAYADLDRRAVEGLVAGLNAWLQEEDSQPSS